MLLSNVSPSMTGLNTVYKQKSTVFAFPDITNVPLEVAKGGFPYGVAKSKPFTKTRTSQ